MVPGLAAAPAEETLQGKRLLVVLGSYRSKRHIYEHAGDLGVRLTVLDGPGHWMGGESSAGLVERHLAMDLSPLATFVERAVGVIRREGLSFDGIGTIDEFAGGFAARIAAALGLRFHDVAAADRARDKHRSRQACAAAGLPGPAFARIESRADLEEAGQRVGFPAVLKPVSGVGSVQTFRVRSGQELAARYDRIVHEVAEAKSGRRSGLSSDRDWFDLMWSGPPTLMLESWIEGRKYDVDLLIESGEVVYAHATDDLEPCGLRDVRRVAPAGLGEEVERELIIHAAACVRALGFTHGAFNVEVKRTDAGPRMIEVNGRLGGYSTTDIHQAVWGVDLVEQWVRSCLNLRLDVRESDPACFVAESLLPSPRTGVLERDGFLEAVRSEPGVLAARPWVFAGDAVQGVETSAPDWLGALLTCGQTRDQALARLDELVAQLSPPVISGADRA
ncbi:MAG: ATP-grasp domain-containing protein [Vicinamibacteria bacterium]